MPLGSGCSRGEVAREQPEVEARERWKKTIFKGKIQSGTSWGSEHGVIKSHEVQFGADRINVA